MYQDLSSLLLNCWIDCSFLILRYWNSLRVCTFHCLLMFVSLFILSFMSLGTHCCSESCFLATMSSHFSNQLEKKKMCLSEWRKGLGSKNITIVPLKSFMSFSLVCLQNCCNYQGNFSKTWQMVSFYALVIAGVLKPNLSAFRIFVILCVWT